MNKTTRNHFGKKQNAGATSFLLLVLLFCTFVSFGQFKVNPNTTFTANNVVSSKEEANVFNSSVLGDNQLVLNGMQQYLETASNTSLPTLRVADANELHIRTALKIRKDLIVQSGILKLEKPLHIKGGVILENDAAIYNQHLIIYENRFVFHKDFTSTATLEILTSSTTLVQNFQVHAARIPAIQTEPITNINESIKNQFKAMPFSPPPEVV